MSKSIMRFISLFLVFQLIVPYSSFAANTGEFKSITGDVRQIRSKVVITPVTDSPILPKDVITTEKASSATMAFPDESIIKLEQNSKLEVMEFLFKEKSRTAIFFLSVGKVAAKVNKYIGGDNVFEVQSPTVIVGVRGTGFEFDEAVNSENKNIATVSCTEGSLNLSALSPERKVVSTAILNAGQVAVIVGGVITISAITAAAGAAGTGATSSTTTSTTTAAASGTGTASTATTATAVTAATAGISTTTIVGVAAGVAAVGAAGAAASSGGGGGSSSTSSSTSTSTSTSTPTSTPTSTTDDVIRSVDTFLVRFTGNYCIESCFDDPNYIVSSATLVGMGNSQHYTYNLYPEHPGEWWDDGIRYCTTSPTFPMIFTTTINFTAGTIEQVTISVTDWVWAE